MISCGLGSGTGSAKRDRPVCGAGFFAGGGAATIAGSSRRFRVGRVETTAAETCRRTSGSISRVFVSGRADPGPERARRPMNVGVRKEEKAGPVWPVRCRLDVCDDGIAGEERETARAPQEETAIKRRWLWT